MDSKAKRGHSSNIAFSKVYYSLILSVHPFAQKELDITTSSGPPDHFLLSYVKAKCIFVGLFGDQVFQVRVSTFMENFNIPGLLTYLC